MTESQSNNNMSFKSLYVISLHIFTFIQKELLLKTINYQGLIIYNIKKKLLVYYLVISYFLQLKTISKFDKFWKNSSE